MHSVFLNCYPARALRGAWPQIVTSSVFGLHALLPAMSTYSAVSVIINSASDSVAGGPDPNGWDLLHRISGAALGIYSLCSLVSRHMQNEHPQVNGDSMSTNMITKYLLRAFEIGEATA